MCVAAIIFKPVSRTNLRHMDNDNPHGAGIACVKNGRIFFLKGLNADAIYELQEAGALSFPYLLHFRWATQGARIAEWCHPFPVGPRALMGETVGFADEVLIHNGTWHDESSYIPLISELPEALTRQASDTAIAAWLLKDNPNLLDEVMWATAHAVMKDGEMDVTTRGTWVEYEGNWYSNLNWLPANKVDWSRWYETSNFSRHYNGFSPQTQKRTPPEGVPQSCKLPDRAADDAKEWDSWEDYCAYRYSKDAEDAVCKEGTDEDSGPVDGLSESDVADLKALKEWIKEQEDAQWKDFEDSGVADIKTVKPADLDVVSEDPEVVNEWLRKQAG